MKKLLLLSVIIFLAVLHLPIRVQAAEGCTSFSVDPPKGDPETSFVIRGTGCGDGGSLYKIRIFKSLAANHSGELNLVTSTSGRIIGTFSTSTRGSYCALLYRMNDDGTGDLVSTACFDVNANEGPTCGDVVDASERNCPSFCAYTIEDGIPRCREGSEKAPVCYGRYGIGFPSDIGCIPFNPVRLAAGGTVFLLGFSGTIALLMIAIAAYSLITSTGDPAKLADAKSRITAAIAGLIMLALGVYLYRVIAVDILGLFGT